MNEAIFSKEVQDYLKDNEDAEITGIVLSGSPFENVTAAELAQQLEGRKKAKTKLPIWYSTSAIYYPPKLNIEQTSSQATAQYKASLAKGASLIDITGGLGIDSYFFSKVNNEVIHCELNDEISQIATHNFQFLAANNIKTVSGDGLDFLKKNTAHFDTIYVDPSRRNESKGKVFILKDCLPNIPEKIDLLLSKTNQLIVKTSPLLDISAGLRELTAVAEIHIVAVNNEVKELLWILKQGVKNLDLVLKTVNILSTGNEVTAANYHEALDSSASFALAKKYLYEPNAALLKSGLFNWIGNSFNLEKLHTNTHLYTSDELIDFPGRRFEIQETLSFNKKNVVDKFGGKKANITTRNFKTSVENIRKKFKIKDGGDDYLFFCSDLNNSAVVIACRKI